MRTIRLGNRGDDVVAWQTFLRGGQIAENGGCTARPGDAIISDGIFGPVTDRATREWQRSRGLKPDGVVGRDTWGHAVADSFPQAGVPTKDLEDHDADVDRVDVDDAVDQAVRTSAAWPPRPDWARPLVSKDQRDRMLGRIEVVPSPTDRNPERVRITNGWARKHIERFQVPQLSSKPIAMHRLAGPQFQAWLAACEKRGVLNITGYAGCWVPRFVRGSRTSLSNHCWACAIDVNVPYNRRGRQGALVGQKGCVREMASLAPAFGIFWGGWYRGAPVDSMHFEVFKILSDHELQAVKEQYGVA